MPIFSQFSCYCKEKSFCSATPDVQRVKTSEHSTESRETCCGLGADGSSAKPSMPFTIAARREVTAHIYLLSVADRAPHVYLRSYSCLETKTQATPLLLDIKAHLPFLLRPLYLSYVAFSFYRF